MGTLASQFAGLDVRENCFLGKDFIVEVEKKLKELNIEKINLVHYIGKVVMSQTSEGESLQSYEDAVKIIQLNEETFTLKKKQKTGWCANYMQDKGYNEATPGVCFSFAYVNHSSNPRAQEDHIVDFKPCKCYSCKQSDKVYTQLFSN